MLTPRCPPGAANNPSRGRDATRPGLGAGISRAETEHRVGFARPLPAASARPATPGGVSTAGENNGSRLNGWRTLLRLAKTTPHQQTSPATQQTSPAQPAKSPAAQPRARSTGTPLGTHLPAVLIRPPVPPRRPHRSATRRPTDRASPASHRSHLPDVPTDPPPRRPHRSATPASHRSRLPGGPTANASPASPRITPPRGPRGSRIPGVPTDPPSRRPTGHATPASPRRGGRQSQGRCVGSDRRGPCRSTRTPRAISCSTR